MSFNLLQGFAINRWPLVPLRLIVGFGFMEHGFAKLSKGPDAFTAILHAIGVPAPHLMAWLTILIEIVGGFAVILGGLVPLVAVPMAAVVLPLPGPVLIRIKPRREDCSVLMVCSSKQTPGDDRLD